MVNKVEDLNLYQIHVCGNCYANQIEATSDQQARAIAAGAVQDDYCGVRMQDHR